MILRGDICRLNGAELKSVDVVTGGSPCQNISISGNGTGLGGIESRLFFEQMRIIREMREAAGSTRYMIWENVANIFSCNSGNDFRRVLSETVSIADEKAGKAFDLKDVPKNGWRKAGALFGGNWSVAWRLTNARFFGVPQSRRRIAVVADFDGLSAADMLFGTKPLDGTPARPVMFEKFEDGAWTECPDETAKHSDYGEGPEIPVEVDLADVLEPDAGPEYYLTVKACEGIFKRAAKRHKEISAYLEKGLSGNIVLDPRNNGLPEGTPRAVEALHHNGFGDYRAGTFTSALKASGGDVGFGSECLVVTEFAKEGREPLYCVRRLSVTECERAQGFPDGWTDIGEEDAATGEKFFTDTNGVRRKVTPAQRGKALGNSIALPFWQYLADRICAEYDRPVTMGSLFDGISGFPLVFTGSGALPVWSSEIEEYPAAVCRAHFGDEEKGVKGDIGKYI